MRKKAIFPLHVDKMKDGHVEKFSETLPEDLFMFEKDDELVLEKRAHISGEAYITDDFLIVSFSATATFKVPCGFCNNPFSFEVSIEKEMHEVPLEEIHHNEFDLGELVREEVLLEIPYYPLCGKDKCLKRKEVEKYLHKHLVQEFHPFENL